MANYKETMFAGSSYTRAYNISIDNSLEGQKRVIFAEEEVISFAGETIRRPKDLLVEPFNTENINTEFNLVNPDTSTDTGE